MKATGASGGRVQSALLVPVPAAEPLVRRWRLAYDPVAPEGVPAHITLIVPWLPPDRLVEPDFARLADVLADVKAFDFCLATVGWFGRRVLWLGPEPAEPFLALTARLAARFDTPPWGDEFDEVVPHLTVGHDPAWPGRAPAGAAEAGRGGRAPAGAAEAGGGGRV
ncbi:MAG: 2'-5' RNA ligase family protein, partial [Acidimicrobiales bacterium]